MTRSNTPLTAPLSPAAPRQSRAASQTAFTAASSTATALQGGRRRTWRTVVTSGLLAAVAGSLLLIVAPQPVQAQAQAGSAAPRIGFVRTERILRESNAAKAAQQKIERDFSKRDKELGDVQNRLKTLTDRYDKDAAVMSEADRSRRQREIADMDKDFQRRQREFREDLNQRRNEDLAVVLERANSAIKQIAEEEKFDLILQEAVYVGPRIDITDRVVKALNSAP